MGKPSRHRPASSPTAPNREAVQQTVQALGLSLPDRATDQLTAYAALLLRWNTTYNLTALRDPAQVLTHHLADCLAILQPLRCELMANTHPRLLDVGSGGGLPGILLAIAEPQWQIDCIDTVGKKVAFIRQAAGELALPNLQGLHGRVEALAEARYDVVVSRAFATLADFTRWSRPALRPGGCWAAMKGVHPNDEIAALATDVAVFHVEHLQVPGLDAERCLVLLRPCPHPADPS